MQVSVNGTKLFFDIEGASLKHHGTEISEKPSLILLHGGPGSDHSMFRPYFSSFADIAQVVYLDLRGQGRSERSNPDQWNIANWADDVKGFCDNLGINNPIVLGHSVGGMVAMQYATKYPEHPGKLILAHTVGSFNLDRLLDRFERIGGDRSRIAAEGFWKNPSEETLIPFREHCSPVYNQRWCEDLLDVLGRVENRPEVSVHFWRNEGESFNILSSLDNIQCQTLIFGGNKDPFSGLDDLNEIVESIPNSLSTYTELDDCGHFFWWDAPEDCRRILRDFISYEVIA